MTAYDPKRTFDKYNKYHYMTKSLYLRLGIISILYWYSLPSTASEQCYKHLVFDYGPGRAGNYPVCRAFLKNINHYCDEKVPLNRVLIHEGFQKLKNPKWIFVEDWRKYFNVVADAMNTIKSEVKYQRLKQSFQDQNTKMWIGKINLDNYKGDETVLRLNSDNSIRRGFNMIIPFNKITGKYDNSYDSIINKGAFDAFIYDNNTYLMWEKNWNNISESYEIHISEPHHSGTRPGVFSSICVFSYTEKHTNE